MCGLTTYQKLIGSPHRVQFYHRQVLIELKPSIGDDYPKIIRMVSKWPIPSYDDNQSKCVYTDRYQGAVPVEQVKELFRRNGIVFLTAADFN